jgi:hypothetical protein
MADKKSENIQFFRTQLPELLKNQFLRGKFVVVYSQQVQGAFDTFEAALKNAIATYPADEFIVQQVIEDSAMVSFLRAM